MGLLAAAGCSADTEESSGAGIQAFGPGGQNDPSGEPSAGSPDPTGNVAEPASTAVCEPGATRCGNGGSLDTCNSEGTGFESAACASGTLCIGGLCARLSCEAGQLLCLGAEIHRCNDDEESTSLVSTCGPGEACNSATFGCQQRLCEPLVATCNGNVATRCDFSGNAYDEGANVNCGTLTCRNGACVDPVTGLVDDSSLPTTLSQSCSPGAVSCVGNALTTCNSEGTGSTAQPCGDGECDAAAGVCLAPQQCTPLERACDGLSAFGTCSADGRTFESERCPDGTNCQDGGDCAPVSCNESGLTRFDGGEATVYWFGQGTVDFGDIACGYGIEVGNLGNGDGDSVNGIADTELFAAMNTANFQTASACGACVQMEYQGRSVTVTVVDECPIDSNPTCTAGHIDLSRGAWNALTGGIGGTQIFGVNWQIVPCEVSGPVTVELKEPENQYWNEFLVRNHRYPIARAEVLREDGTWVEAERMPYNFFHPPEDDMGTYRVRITDINGGVIEEQLALTPGAQGGNSQFACQ